MMRGCSFAEDFLSEERCEQNDGVFTDTGHVVFRGLALTGTSHLNYDIVSQPGGFSVVVRFKTGTVNAAGSLIANGTAAVSGFWIYLTSTGIAANHSNGAVSGTLCEAPISYADNQEHTVTYVVDMAGGTHTLYVDGLTAVTEATAINEEIGDAAAIYFGVAAGIRLVGTILKARVFNALLTEAEHDVYHAGTLETYFNRPWAAYRCDSFNDDTDGDYIWDRGTNMRDLNKADRATSSKYPTLATTPSAHYVFDGVDDYLTNPNTLPSAYTITGAKSASGYAAGTANPVIQQHNDTTFLDDLDTEGGHSGNLHSLVIHDKVLSPIELLDDEYRHMYWLWRGRMFGALQRLFVEGACVFSLYPDYAAYPFTDYAGGVIGTVSGTLGGGGADGVWFQRPTGSELVVDNDMEAAGVGDWAVVNAATLTKDVTNPHGGTRCLRVAHNGTSDPGARQTILTVSDLFRATGWARGDGTYLPWVHTSGTVIYSGDTGTTWKSYSKAFTAATTTLTYYSNASAAGNSEHDDVSVFKILNDGYLTYPDSAALECDECTIVVYGDFSGAVQPGTIVDKGTNYKLQTNGNEISFNGSAIAHTFDNNESIAVSVKPGEKPRFSVDGVYIGEGTTVETPDSADATELTIGTNNEHDEATQYQIKQVHIFNQALTDV
jgi:hypothetical protein